RAAGAARGGVRIRIRRQRAHAQSSRRAAARRRKPARRLDARSGQLIAFIMPGKGRIIVVTPNEPFPFGQSNGRWCHALLKGLDDSGWRVRCLSVTQNREWERGAREFFAGSGVEMTFYPLGAVNGTSPLRRKW